MSEMQPSRRIGRSIGAIFAGFLAGAILSLGTDQVLHLLKIYPPWGQTMSDGLFLLATAYRIAYTIVGGYVAARLAPDRPMKHAMILGAIGLALSIAGAVVTWNRDLGPHWYAIVIAAIAIPCSWLGARLALQPRTQAA